MKWMERIKNRIAIRSERYRRIVREVNAAQRTVDRLQSENAELSERIPEIVKKLARVEIQRPTDPRRKWRCVVTFDPRGVEDGLLWGNDKTTIEYLSRYIGHMAQDAIEKMNYSRWET